jgi:hypothetical protein
MLTKLRCFLVCTILLQLASAARAATLNVGPGQTYTTIQSAINAANTGDTVLVAPGTYYENIDFKGKAITVTSSGGASVTTIDGGGLAPTVTFQSEELRTAVLSNLTITHGGLSNPGSSQFVGAGISISNSAPTILNNIVTQNYCQNIEAYSSAPLIQGNIVSSSLNAAQCGVENTGGINIGAAYYSFGKALYPVVLGNTIENNTTGEVGDGGGDGGAGIWDDAAGNLVIEANIIRNNTTKTGNGGAILTFNADNVTIFNNLVYGNASGCGGAITFEATGPASPYNYLIANNTIADNTATSGGGYSNCSQISQIYPNSFSYGSSSPGTAIINNIISGSTTYPAITCALYQTPNESDQPTFQNNILYNAGGPFFASNCVDVSGKYNNIASDPQFVSPSTGDYHLKSTSPAIDSGENSALQNILSMAGVSLSTDLDGNARVQDATGKGCTIDIGAYEYPGTQSLCSTSITLTSSLNPSIYGQTVTFTAQLSSANGVPTGSVQFSDGATILGTETISNAGVSTFTTGLLSIGSHTITATYQPTGAFPAANATLTQNVTGIATTTTVTCPFTTLYDFQTSLLSASVTSTSGSPTGAITFTDNGVTLAQPTLTSGATADYTWTAQTVGTHTLAATYVPTGTFAASSASCSVTVLIKPSTISIASSLNPSSAGQNVTFTATVVYGGPPQSFAGAGSITFMDGSIPLGTVSLTSTATPQTFTATYSTSNLATGSHNITAILNPLAGYAAGSASLTQIVNQLSSTSVLSVAPPTATYGTPITLTATVSPSIQPGAGAPSGSVTFYNGSTVLGTATLNAGVASMAFTSIPVGVDSLTCTYGGDSTYGPSSCTAVPVTVTASPTTLTLTSSANPSPALTPITFTAHLASASGPVAKAALTLTYNPTLTTQVVVPLTTDANGNASYTVATGLIPGSYTIAATFAAATGYQASSTALTEIVTGNLTTTTLTASPNPANQGNTVTLSAVVTATTGTADPFGTVTFLDGVTPLATIGLTGSTTSITSSASFSTSTLTVGQHALTAVYTPGNTSFLASQSSIFSETINPQDFSLTADPPSISIQTEHHASMQLLLTSTGGFAAPITLTCGFPLPVYVTCTLPPPAQLTANGTAPVTLTLDTDGVPDFLSANRTPNLGRLALAALIPFTLLGFARRRRLRNLFACALLAALAVSLTACANTYPGHTPPGTYTIPITATGTSAGSTTPTSHTLNITLTVTQ